MQSSACLPFQGLALYERSVTIHPPVGNEHRWQIDIGSEVPAIRPPVSYLQQLIAEMFLPPG